MAKCEYCGQEPCANNTKGCYFANKEISQPTADKMVKKPSKKKA